MADENLIDVINLKKYFPIRAGIFKRHVDDIKAVDDVSFDIRRGETLGLVGESGCGKTTVGRAIMMLAKPSEGHVFFEAPIDVVENFKKLVNSENEFASRAMTNRMALETARLVERVLNSPHCNFREKKKKHLCTEASNLMKRLSKLNPEAPFAFRDQELTRLLRLAKDEIADRYCINHQKKSAIRKMRSRLQFVFQDPFSSLDPRLLIKDIVAEPLKSQRRKLLEKRKDIWQSPASGNSKFNKRMMIRNRVVELLKKVGLNIEHLYRYPHEFSGGQRQRIGIARALSVNPDFIVLDEPTSALDVSVQAQILNMLNDLQKDMGLTYMFISHDLSTVRYMCDRVAVMYLGKIVETAPKKELFDHPVHPYTEALLSVIPVADPDLKRERIILTGDVPSPVNPPSGCRFHTRCPLVKNICTREEPPLRDRGNAHFVACHVR